MSFLNWLKNRNWIIKITRPWLGEDRLDNQKPIEKKDTPLNKWLNRR